MRAVMIVAAACVPIALAAQTRLGDFAKGAEIRTDGSGSIFRLVLSDDVYDTATREDLGDLRVINAAGDSVPHALRRAPSPEQVEADWRTVPSFPMTEAQTRATAKTQVRVGTDGAVLEVTNEPNASRTTTAYLVDATAIKEPLAMLSVSWDAPPNVTFLARVNILASDDLNSWQTIVASAALAQLRRDELTLTQNEIEIPATTPRLKYLRISWPRELAAATLTSVRVRPRSDAIGPEIRWRMLTADRVEPPGSAQYDARGRFPVGYVDLEFADGTDTATVTVRSHPASSSTWATRYTGVFYSLEHSGRPVRNSPARIGPTNDRHWAVDTKREGGWKPDRAPRLKIGWHPHELLFVAQGAAPYTLVYGSARAEPAGAPVDTLLANLTQAERDSQVRIATLGEARTLAGADALTPELPWRRIVLWAVLIAAVAVLAVIALRVFRDTQQTADGGRP
jgi:hypothetical protein